MEGSVILNSIFVQIASYRDPQLTPTIRNMIAKADHPENLIFSIVWQHKHEDRWDNVWEFYGDPRFKIIDISYEDSKGCCWARSLCQRQYNDERYTLQIDSHMRFVDHWDTILIEMLESLRSKGHSKPILSTYPAPFDPDTFDEENPPDCKPMMMKFYRFSKSGIPYFIPDYWNEIFTRPVRSRFMSGGFVFADGTLIDDVPHDPNIYFQGEEISMSLRTFTHGYEIFHPHIGVLWHEYERDSATKHWFDNTTSWFDKDQKSLNRVGVLLGINNGKIEKQFGLGTEKTLEDYIQFSGIDFKTSSVQKRTLDNLPPILDFVDESPFVPYKLDSIFFTDEEKTAFLGLDVEYVGLVIYDSYGKELHRYEVSPDDLKDKSISVSYEAKESPHYWCAWPYKNGVWGKRIVRKIESY